MKTKSNFDYDRIKTTTNHNEPLNHQGESVVSYSHSLGKVQVNDQAPPLVTPLARLVQVLGNDEKGIVQLAEDLSITDKKHIRKTYIAPALKQALIEMTIPDKTKSPNQKYRLTEKGKQFLIKGTPK